LVLPQALRDMLYGEAARVQRETVQYSTLTQAALQSTKTIIESLEPWRKIPGTRTLLHALPSITKLRRTAGLAASSGHV
jgi:hypothetical protein